MASAHCDDMMSEISMGPIKDDTAEHIEMHNTTNMVAEPGSVPRMGDDANKIEHDQVHT